MGCGVLQYLKKDGNFVMSDVSTLSGFEPRLNLLPSEIATHPKYDVRPYSSSAQSQQEERLLVELSKSLEEEQLDDCLITEMPVNGNGVKYVMVAGHRRRAAAMLANERRTAAGQGLLKLRCRVVPYSDALERMALISNIQRKDIRPMSLAKKIDQIMKEKGWVGFPGVKRVAAYIGFSTAQITQHLKLLEAPMELQDKLELGELSADSAFDILSGVKPEHVGEVVERAKEHQVRSTATKALKDMESGKKTPEQAQAEIEKASEPGARVESPAVRKAIQEMDEGKRTGPVPLNRKEIIESFDELDSPLYGHPDSAVRVWVRYFVDKFVTGQGTVNTMLKHWDRMVEKADKGTKEAADKLAAKERAEQEAREKAKSTKPAKPTPAKQPNPAKAKSIPAKADKKAAGKGTGKGTVAGKPKPKTAGKSK